MLIRCLQSDVIDRNLSSGLAIAAELYHNRSVPFFLGVGLREPHMPYNYPTTFDHLYPNASTFPIAAHPDLAASQVRS